jgi:hypothetical protein
MRPSSFHVPGILARQSPDCRDQTVVLGATYDDLTAMAELDRSSGSARMRLSPSAPQAGSTRGSETPQTYKDSNAGNKEE